MMTLRVKRLVISAAMGILMLACLCSPAFATEEEQQTVRVGYFDLGSYYQVNENGEMDSYDSAYLNKISEYTGLKFEYVYCGTWNNALAQLRDNEIDLVGTMQWTQEREDTYSISDASYGYSVAELATLDSSPLVYEDYDAMNGSTVGCIDGYVIEDQLRELMANKNLTFTIRTFADQPALDAALENGEIDLLAANAHAIRDEWKIIEKFTYIPFYFAASGNNANLADTISSAIIQINLYESDFDDELANEYFPRMVNSPYSKAEMDCIARNIPYTIYLDGSSAPLAWYDSDTDSMSGVLVDICNRLGSLTGLDLSVRKRTDSSMNQDDTTVTYRTLYLDSLTDTGTETGVTNSILNETFNMYHRAGDGYVSDDRYRIAVVVNRDGLKDYLADQYPQCEVVECDSPQMCLESVSNGSVDMALLDTHVADNAIITGGYDDITALPVPAVSFGIALQFHGENAELLANIVDKGTKLLEPDFVYDSMLSYAASSTPDITLSYMVSHNTELFIGIGISIVVVLATLSALFIYAHMMRRERNRVKAAEQERSDFFARMSHDMRTPMNGILGLVALSKDETDMDELHKNLDQIELSSHYLLNLINDTLDINKMEAGKLELHCKPCSGKTVYENVISNARIIAKDKNVNLVVNVQPAETDDWPTVMMDPAHLEQILINIISNAVKFTPPGGTVEVSMKRLAHSGKTLRDSIIVKDTGIGMHADFLPHLFEPFSQEGRVGVLREEGTGLGMPIVKQLVDLMGGTIKVRSAVGEGTEITITIDFESCEADTIPIEHDIDFGILKGKRVLICEDHPLNARIASELLKKRGMEPVVATDGAIGLALFEQSASDFFDAILMDLRMPNMNGLETTRALRALERPDAATIPIIAMTASAFDSDVQACLEAGMNAHLAKPIDSTALYTTLCVYCSPDDDAL